MKTVSFFSVLLLTACVTINIYFPAAAAEKVADEIINEIQAEDNSDVGQEQSLLPQSRINDFQRILLLGFDKTLSFLISPANAAKVDLSVDTAEIRKLRASMRARFASLKPFYAKGIVGIKKDGFIVARVAVAIKDRNKVKKLIASENADRQRLYRALANANGHPEWFAQIKTTFAARWISHAKSKWWYQNSNGSWKQK